MNPLDIMKIKPLLEKFRTTPPKVPMFFRAVSGKIEVGSIIELSITPPDGEKIVTNIRVTPDDIELAEKLSGMAK